MADATVLAAYVTFLAAVLWWSYRTYRDATHALLDECPWSLEKEPRTIDFRAREAYEALAAREATKEELFYALIQRAVSAIRTYNAIQKEMRDFESVKHLLTDSVRSRELSNLHLIVHELETIENEGNRLSPGWSVDVFRQAQHIIQQEEMAKRHAHEHQQRHARPPNPDGSRPVWSARNVAPVPPRDVLIPQSRAPAVQPLDRARRGAIIEEQKRLFLEAMHRQHSEYQANPSLPPPTHPPMAYPRDPLTGEEYFPVWKTVDTPEGPRTTNVIEFMPASTFYALHAQAAAAANAAYQMGSEQERAEMERQANAEGNGTDADSAAQAAAIDGPQETETETETEAATDSDQELPPLIEAPAEVASDAAAKVEAEEEEMPLAAAQGAA